MKKYKATMYEIIDGEPKFYYAEITCEDLATDFWLNPLFKNVIEVQEIE